MPLVPSAVTDTGGAQGAVFGGESHPVASIVPSLSKIMFAPASKVIVPPSLVTEVSSVIVPSAVSLTGPPPESIGAVSVRSDPTDRYSWPRASSPSGYVWTTCSTVKLP